MESPDVSENRRKFMKNLLRGLILGVLAGIVFYFKEGIVLALISFIVLVFVFVGWYFLKKAVDYAEEIKTMENVFPDFLQLMASNLRAGMTIDKAMLLSSREEFGRLNKEIMSIGKDIATGKEIERALLDMSKRIQSEKISRTILLLISGIKSGGNIAVLLEKTASSLKERNFIEKKASSNVLMYTIFIFFSVSFGAPVLFSLSTVLIETLIGITAGMPMTQGSMSVNAPFIFAGIDISVTFIKYFCLVFMLTLDVLSALIIGLVSRGDEKEGLKYIVPLIAISVSVFFIVRWLLSGFVNGLI